jgi:hypothetical protein
MKRKTMKWARYPILLLWAVLSEHWFVQYLNCLYRSRFSYNFYCNCLESILISHKREFLLVFPNKFWLILHCHHIKCDYICVKKLIPFQIKCDSRQSCCHAYSSCSWSSSSSESAYKRKISQAAINISTTS